MTAILLTVMARMAPSYYSDYEATPSFGVKSSEKLKQAEPTTIACVSAMQIYKDTSYESCFESFCDPTRVGGSGVYLHCRACMCRACSWCREYKLLNNNTLPPPPPRPPPPSPPPPPFYSVKCEALHAGDPVTATCDERRCEPYLPGIPVQSRLQFLCRRCGCALCAFCLGGTIPPAPPPPPPPAPLPAWPPACHSRIQGDSTFVGCEQWCAPAERLTHCVMCKCQGCHFCAPPTPAPSLPPPPPPPPVVSPPPEIPAPDVPPEPPSPPPPPVPCEPVVEGDTTYRGCLGHYCGRLQWGARCNRCACKECGYCKNPKG